eukprot:gene7577-8416_t
MECSWCKRTLVAERTLHGPNLSLNIVGLLKDFTLGRDAARNMNVPMAFLQPWLAYVFLFPRNVEKEQPSLIGFSLLRTCIVRPQKYQAGDRRFASLLLHEEHTVSQNKKNAQHPKDEAPVQKEKDVMDNAEPTIECNKSIASKENEVIDSQGTNHINIESLEGSPRIYRTQDVSESDLSTQKIFDVAEMSPEHLGIAVTDKIFKEAVDLLSDFIDISKEFRDILLKFERRYSKDKRPDFKKCYQVYMRNKDLRKSQIQLTSEEQGSHFGLDDNEEESVEELLRLMQSNGTKLIETGEKIKPDLDAIIEDAEKHDTKEYVKEKIEEDGQQGLLSKFSAPGKYRRNMKQLKKQRRFLDDIPAEVRSILSIIEEEKSQLVAGDNKSKETQKQDTPAGSPVTSDVADQSPVITVHVEDVVISKPSHLTTTEENSTAHHVEAVDGVEDEDNKQPDPVSQPQQQPFQPAYASTPSPVVESEITEQVVRDDEHENEIIFEEDSPNKALNGSAVHNESQVSERERADVILPLRPSSPSIPLVKARAESWDPMEERNLVDYGSYLVLDPTANDDGVIMRRSRSLDSLSSIGSRRSAMSRYGSFEFVTDYEIKIADKAETEKALKMLKAPPRLQTNAPALPPVAITKHKQPVDRHTTSPIYKYTEVDYNPFGL